MSESTIARQLSRIFLWALVVGLVVLWKPRAAAASPAFELPSVLSITKSSNRNRVDYALVVDDSCVPLGTAPVRPYWRMLERSALATETLTGREETMLGVERQSVDGHRVQLVLRGFPGRTMVIETQRSADGRCASQATTTIAGVAAKIANVFVNQSLFGKVDYVQLTGWAGGGSVVHERITH
jgi:hypothetical protein